MWFASLTFVSLTSFYDGRLVVLADFSEENKKLRPMSRVKGDIFLVSHSNRV